MTKARTSPWLAANVGPVLSDRLLAGLPLWGIYLMTLAAAIAGCFVWDRVPKRPIERNAATWAASGRSSRKRAVVAILVLVLVTLSGVMWSSGSMASSGVEGLCDVVG